MADRPHPETGALIADQLGRYPGGRAAGGGASGRAPVSCGANPESIFEVSYGSMAENPWTGSVVKLLQQLRPLALGHPGLHLHGEDGVEETTPS